MFLLKTRNLLNVPLNSQEVLEVCQKVCYCSSFARINSLNKIVSDNKLISVKGWVKSVRKLKNNIFVDVNDGSCSRPLQVVVPKESFDTNISYGSSVEVYGKLASNSKNQLELLADQVNVVGINNLEEYPFRPKKSYTNEYIRQYLHLRFRTKGFSSLLRVRHAASFALNDYFHSKGYLNIHTPFLTSNDCEGAGEVFTVIPDCKDTLSSMKNGTEPYEEVFFGSKVYLTVSGQLHLEAAARGLGDVYTFGPTFRAENSKSRLHLSEFFMAEAETAFTSNIEDITSLCEGLVKHMTEVVLNSCSEDVYICRKDLGDIVKSDMKYFEDTILNRFTVMSYNEAADIIMKNADSLSIPFVINQSFSKEHELFLVKYNSYKPIFIVDWPSTLKPFYMKQDPNDPSKVVAFDLLCNVVGELCGGSLRENDYAKLEHSLKENNMLDQMQWYLEIRKFGNVMTGGFGMGFERYLQVLLNITNIKDVIPYPRYPHNCKM